jgi:EAL domain-containing protein (putative c-di-GMP-specific phosphodiesterase class I)
VAVLALSSSVISGEHRAWRWLGPSWSAAVAVAGALLGAWAATYLAGGTRTALPHLFYVGIIVAAVAFGTRGGVAAGLVAALLCGPLLPLDTATGEGQVLANWLIRGTFFVGVGTFVGAVVTALRASYRTAIEERIGHELELVTSPLVDVPPDAQVEVRALLEERRFHPLFQPIYRLDDGQLLAVEALTRFETDPYEPPDVWFRRAEAAGVAVDLELAAVAAAIAASEDRLSSEVALSLNCSPAAILDPRLLALVERAAPRPVILEVTEHAVVSDYARLGTAMADLRARGVRLAVDDAGAGFASLRHIVRLAPEIIKLDISLTQDVRHDPIRRALADALIGFANQMGSWLIAEGIETSADLSAWRGLGAQAAQGYLLGRPGPLPVPARCRSLDEPAASFPLAARRSA